MEDIKKMKVLCDCGKSGTARKILVQDKDKRLYTCYYYMGNPLQNFVVDEKENLILDSYLLSDIIITCGNYVFYNYKGWN